MGTELDPKISDGGGEPRAQTHETGRPAETKLSTRRVALGMTAAATAGVLADRALLSPDSARAAEVVESVNGLTGKVTLTAASVGAVPAAELTVLPGENLAIGEGAFASFVGESEEEHKKHRGNTAVGWHALHNFTGTHETSSEDNTAVGSQALGFLTTGGGNTAVGENAGVNLTSGEENVAIGCESLAAQQTATGNIAVGFRALYNNSTGAGLVAIGFNAASANTTGKENSVLGVRASMANKVGFRLAAFGFEALTACLASENTAFGALAGKAITSGSQNTAIGSLAMNGITTGVENTVVGQFGLGKNVSGSRNTAIGAFAGEGNEGSGNVFVGAEAGSKEKGSNKLYIANSATTEPLILGNFEGKELRFYTTKIGFYGVAPVARAAAIAEPTEAAASLKAAINSIRAAMKGIGITL